MELWLLNPIESNLYLNFQEVFFPFLWNNFWHCLYISESTAPNNFFLFFLFVQCLYIDFEAYCFVITSRGAKPGLLEPFADLFWLSALHVRIYHMKKELATENKNKNKNIPGTIRMIILSPVPTMPVPDQAPAIK